MAIIKTVATHNGAQANFHAVTQLLFFMENGQLTCQATLSSWPTQEMYEASASEMSRYIFTLLLQPSATMIPDAETLIIAGDSQWGGGSYIDVAPPSPLQAAKDAKWASIKQTREQLDVMPIELAGGFPIDADRQSRMDLMGAIMAMQITDQTSRYWRCADNVMRELTLNDLIAVGSAIAARRQNLVETSDAIWQSIQAATTVEQVRAVTWVQ